MWYHEHIGKGRFPVVDTWWQTETGQIMITPLPGVTTTKPGSATFPLPGISVEVVDLRSLRPLDRPTIIESVKKTGRCVVVHEATRTSGFGAELVSLVQEHCFYHLEAPIERVAGSQFESTLFSSTHGVANS